MTPAPGPDQRRRDGRLAWIIVGCSAATTLVVLIVALWALSGPLTRGVESMATTNSSAPTPERGNAAGEETPDRPSTVGEVRKRATDEQDADDGASVRRGEGTHERRGAPAGGRVGPIA